MSECFRLRLASLLGGQWTSLSVYVGPDANPFEYSCDLVASSTEIGLNDF